MRFIKIFLIIILIFITLSIWANFQYRIEYFFGNPSKEKIVYLQKEVKENNLTAVFQLMIFYTKQHDNIMFKKYYNIQHQLLKYCKNHEDKCEE